MALDCEVGQYVLASGTGSQTVNLAQTGLTPKALLLWTSGNTGLAYSSTSHFRCSTGIGLSSTSRAQHGGISSDGVGTSYCRRNDSDQDIYRFNDDGNPTGSDGEGDLTSFSAGSFDIDLEVDRWGAAYMNYMVWGGSDLTNTHIKQITTPISAQSINYTDIGFEPDALILITGARAAIVGYDSGNYIHSIGWAVNDGGPTNIALGTGCEDAQSRSDTYSILSTVNAVHAIHQGADRLVGEVTGFLSNGYTINWKNVGASAFYVHVLAMKGGQWYANNHAMRTTTGVEQYSGVGFTPKGCLFASKMSITNDTIEKGMNFMLGGMSASAENTCYGVFDRDNRDPTEVYSQESDADCLQELNHTARNVAGDFDAFVNGRFDINFSAANGTAYQFGSLVCGDAAAAGRLPKIWQHNQSIHRATRW